MIIEGHGHELILGDCLDEFEKITKPVVIITDPPYGVEFRNEEWDKSIPPWYKPAKNLDVKLIAFTTAPTTMWDYPRPDWVCAWHRIAAASRSNEKGKFNHWTPILFYNFDGKPRLPNPDFYETAFGKTVNENKGWKIEHKSPKPLELMMWMVNNMTFPGETVLDPFMGSGTTGVACVRLGNRNFIGIEKKKDHYEEAVNRMMKETSQGVFVL